MKPNLEKLKFFSSDIFENKFRTFHRYNFPRYDIKKILHKKELNFFNPFTTTVHEKKKKLYVILKDHHFFKK